MSTLPEACCEDRIEHIAHELFFTAMSESLAAMVGPKTLLVAIDRMRADVVNLCALQDMPLPSREWGGRMQDLRQYLGLPMNPDARGTTNGRA